MWQYSRRGFSGFLLALLLRPPRLPAQPSVAPPSPGHATSRTYRADAVILLLGLPIYKRPGVGGGQASIEETGEGASLRRILFFAAGSDPKRARGLSRLGWMREQVLGPDAAPSESSYFGVLTSSPEESLEHARKAVDSQPGGRSTFAAVTGRNSPGHTRSGITHFEFSADAGWNDRALIDLAQATFRGSVEWRETSWPKSPDRPPPTFLLLLATLLKQRASRATGRYVYNEQEYQLELDAPAGHSREHLLLVRGKIKNLRTGFESPFRLWLETSSDSIVPVRFEFQPRSFLRLTFEAVPV